LNIRPESCCGTGRTAGEVDEGQGRQADMKRKLSGRQLGRIRGRQQALAGKAGQDVEAGDESGDGLGPEQSGLVISHYGQQLEVEALEGERRGERFRCHQRSNLEPLVAGDRVIWRPAEPFGVVLAVLPRRSLLTRPAFQGELRAVAANIDTLLVVIDRKSTRLNSSHVKISYAVFCLKKKK